MIVYRLMSATQAAELAALCWAQYQQQEWTLRGLPQGSLLDALGITRQYLPDPVVVPGKGVVVELNDEAQSWTGLVIQGKTLDCTGVPKTSLTKDVQDAVEPPDKKASGGTK